MASLSLYRSVANINILIKKGLFINIIFWYLFDFLGVANYLAISVIKLYFSCTCLLFYTFNSYRAILQTFKLVSNFVANLTVVEDLEYRKIILGIFKWEMDSNTHYYVILGKTYFRTCRCKERKWSFGHFKKFLLN